MAIDFSLWFDDMNKNFVALVTDLKALYAVAPGRPAPTSGLELGRMLDVMKANDTLSFIFEGWQQTAVHRLFSAFTAGTKMKAKLTALQEVYKPETTVKCHPASVITGTNLYTVQCETFELAKKGWSRIVEMILDVQITQFIPVPAPKNMVGRYLVDLEISGWIERPGKD